MTRNVTTTFPEITESARAFGRVDSRVAGARDAAIAAYKAAGVETDGMKTAFLAGYMAGALNLTGKDSSVKVLAILEKKGFGSKARAYARRTEKQESAYTAARQALARVRKAAGIEPADKRGTNSKIATGQDTVTESDKAKAGEKKTPATMIPAAVSSRDAAAFLLAYANKSPKVFTGESGKALQRAIVSFAKAQNADEPAH